MFQLHHSTVSINALSAHAETLLLCLNHTALDKLLNLLKRYLVTMTVIWHCKCDTSSVSTTPLHSIESSHGVPTKHWEMSRACIKAVVISGIADIEATVSNFSSSKYELSAGDLYVRGTIINHLHSSINQLWTQHRHTQVQHVRKTLKHSTMINNLRRKCWSRIITQVTWLLSLRSEAQAHVCFPVCGAPW